MGDGHRIRTPAEALDLARRHGIVTLAPAGDCISLVREIVGAPIKGSWWGHPKGRLIYALANALEESGEILVAKLVQGKITFIHSLLWPALYRVVTDPAWRAEREKGLSAAGRRLLGIVQRADGVRLDQLAAHAGVDRKSWDRAKTELEKNLLVHAEQVHTESGNHATIFRSWERWASPEVKAAAARLSFEEACHGLGPV